MSEISTGSNCKWKKKRVEWNVMCVDEQFKISFMLYRIQEFFSNWRSLIHKLFTNKQKFLKINKIYNNNNFWPINRINHSEKRTCELYFNRIEWPIQLSDYYRIETRLFLESSSIIHRQHSPILSEIFIEIRLDLLYDDIIYTRRVSTFPTKKLIVT